MTAQRARARVARRVCAHAHMGSRRDLETASSELKCSFDRHRVKNLAKQRRLKIVLDGSENITHFEASFAVIVAGISGARFTSYRCLELH